MIRTIVKVALFILLMPFAVLAQSAPAPFSLMAQPIALPGGHQTVDGSISGLSVGITQNFELREDNLIAPASNLQGFFGGFNYYLPVLSQKLNNLSPQLNGTRFQFYLSASVGQDRLTGAHQSQHYAFLAGGGLRYDLTASGHYSLGAEVRYAKLPGLANNTAIVSVGPSIHF